jgi:RNA polymerase sigma-70 factor (ECF subfamily)
MIQERYPLSDDDLELDPRVMLIQHAVEGDRQATGQLLAVLTPVIRSSVAAVLARAGGGRRQARQEVEDTVQSVLLALFADRGRVLLQWDPARGLKLESFVALLAKRETVSILRSRRRNPFTEDPTLNEDLDRNPVARMGPESEAISRDMVMALALAVQARLTPKAAELFDLLFIKALPNEEVNQLTGLSIDAIYAWRSRLAKQVKEIVAELGASPSSRPPPPPRRDGAGGHDGSYRLVPSSKGSRPRADGSAPRAEGSRPQASRASSLRAVPRPRDSEVTPPPASGATPAPSSGASLPGAPPASAVSLQQGHAHEDGPAPGVKPPRGAAG